MSPRSTSSDSVGNKRSACDRCRSHKLRCERGSTSTCRRCEKAKAICTTAPALKSGRPIQNFNVYQEQEVTASDDVTEYANMSPAPAVEMATTVTLETPPEFTSYESAELHQMAEFPHMGDMSTIWSHNFDQSNSFDSMNPASGIYQPAETRHSLNRLADLQAKILTDLDTVKACKTIEQCPESMEPTGSISSQNVLIGQTLDHSTILLDLLNHLLPGQETPSSIPACDTPTLYALMSCFVSLTRIYRTIFSSILDSMPLLSAIPPPIPQIFPGMHLGGFKLEDRVDLQIQILVQISEDMISKIEAKFGLYDDCDTTNGEIPRNGKMARMLRLMLNEESNEQPPLYEPRGYCKPLKEIIFLLKTANWGSHHP